MKSFEVDVVVMCEAVVLELLFELLRVVELVCLKLLLLLLLFDVTGGILGEVATISCVADLWCFLTIRFLGVKGFLNTVVLVLRLFLFGDLEAVCKIEVSFLVTTTILSSPIQSIKLNSPVYVSQWIKWEWTHRERHLDEPI